MMRALVCEAVVVQCCAQALFTTPAGFVACCCVVAVLGFGSDLVRSGVSGVDPTGPSV
jgi:hypothetical protein